eukprot:TRINITY_DN17717_c0_g1_i1.p1 TRINITY_DN17717_c0_g1~~TRINITY_DN17717_c0_g1_i1.p1  ORF type:complete len:310 (+),score=42.23 TRINITY_DN17717_c0_g1_i1:37-930(+)
MDGYNCTIYAGICLSHRETINLLYGCLGLVSLLSSFFLLVSIIILKWYQTRQGYFVTSLVVSELLRALYGLFRFFWVSSVENNRFCEFMGVFDVFTYLCVGLWEGLMVNWHALLLLSSSHPPALFDSATKVTWFLAIFTAVIGPLMFGSGKFYAPLSDSTWCGIAPKFKLAREMAFIGWPLLINAYIAMLTISLILYVRFGATSQHYLTTTKFSNKFLKQGAGFPLCYVLLSVPGVAVYIMGVEAGGAGEALLGGILGSLGMLRGIWNLIYYGYNRSLWKKLMKKMQSEGSTGMVIN